MKQLVQSFKSGELSVKDIPPPALMENSVLVENHFSLISAGTERGTVKVAKANLLGKAKQRPDLVAQVLQNIKKEGLKATIQKVTTKLDSPKALGYSTAGTVLASTDSSNRYKKGDRVACAGQDYASHAEIVAIPQNLVAKIPDNVSFEAASYTTLGAIALQGVRQADPKLGDNVLVIGLGLLGQLTCQLLKANGCRVFGVDLSDELVSLSKKSGSDFSCNRKDSNILSNIEKFTNGNGFDSIIITAATTSKDPIELSVDVARKKGRIVVVGAVNMDIPRDPHFYRKELELRISTSYGPGRYDHNYEELGQEYPIGYVRWTEQRNMEAFLDLISRGYVNVDHLTTHRFEIEQAEKAYDYILGKETEFSLGILLKYNGNHINSQIQHSYAIRKSVDKGSKIGFIGAGSFAQSYLIPNIDRNKYQLDTVVTSKGITAESVGSKFGFNNISTDPSEVINNDTIDAVFIATRHNTHAELVEDSLKNNKHVFVEKPLAMNIEELESVAKAYKTSNSILLTGFNRRFSSSAKLIRQEIESSELPKMVQVRVNAGYLPPDHWTQVKEIGGGRIIGEVCHFIDLVQFITGENPIEVFAQSLPGLNNEITNNDNVSISLKMDKGSVASILYTSSGDKALPKEYVEVYSAGKVLILDDFKKVVRYSNNSRKEYKLQGKGHREEVSAFLESLASGSQPISFESQFYTTLTTFKIEDSLKTGLPQKIKDDN